MSIRMKSTRSALLLAFLLFVGSISAQTVKVSVKDSQGEAVIGASVIEQGTRNGGVTDFDGNFTINLSADKPIVISYIGMKTKTVNAKGKTEVNVVLEEDATTLNDVVVIGYGTMRKKDLTGSVATVNSEVLQAVPVASATEALAGKMAGVNITTSEGSPDADVKIRVRGGGSITGDNTPLFIVDGFPVESISDIPASDIEDMTVLKDASSTAIYGSRGANGVILITTKSGKEGKVSVTYNAYYSWKKMAKKLDVLSGRDYVNWQYEYAKLHSGKDDKADTYESLFGNYQDVALYDNVPTNDWQDVVFGRTGHTFNHNLNISGGNDKTKFSFGYAYMDDKAIMVGSSFRRDNLSLKLNHKANKNITLDFSVRYSNTKVRGAGANESKKEVSSADSRMKNVMIYTPFNFTDLSEGYDPEFQLTNPLISVYDNDRKQQRQTFDLNGSITWEIFKDFKFKSEFGLQHYYNEDLRFYGVTTYNARENGAGNPMSNFADTRRKTFRNTNTINYDFKELFGKDSPHKLNVLVGEETIMKNSNDNTDIMYNYPADFSAEQAWAMSSLAQAKSINKYYNADDNLLSFFGRVNYDYKGKYLVSATLRADGSSKFADGKRWGYFPSAAIAWRISDEAFMEKTRSWLDDLKLRFSYGTAGNNNIPVGQNSRIWEAGSGNSVSWISGQSSYFTTGSHMANPDLTWETTITRNIGLDFTLFGGKVNGTAEYYWNTTKDLLIEFPVSGSGYNYQYQNLGETENKGFEFSFTYHIVDKKDWGIDLTGNIGFNKNKVKDLGSLQTYNASAGWASTQIQSDYRVVVGEAVGQIYGYRNAGRYEVSDFDIAASKAAGEWVLKEGVPSDGSVIGNKYLRPGALKLVDINGDGVVNDNDREIIGDTNPKATGGFAINGRYKGFDLSANFTYSIGNDVYNANKIEYTSSYQYKYRNLITEMEQGKRWTNINADGKLLDWNDASELAAINANTSMWSPFTSYVLSDWAIENGSFLRLSTITLGYTLPQQLTKRVHINSLRFYFTCHNVFCITGYSGFDPEVSTRNKTALTPGVDYSAYPKSRQFVVGLNLNF